MKMLHESVSQGCCLCHIQATTILQQLDLSSLVTGQGLGGEISISARDEVLVRLGLITSFTEMNHCSKLKEVQQALLASDIFENLLSLLSSTDQLVAYCASKCLEVHLQKLAKNGKHLAEGLLRRAVMSILHSREEFDQNNTSSIMNRTIFTLDILTNILRGGSTRSDNAEDQITLPCMGASTLAEDEGSRSTSQSHDKPTFDLTGSYYDVIKESIPELCVVFSSQFDTISNRHCVSTHPQPSICWFQSLDPSSKHKICHAFLRLLYSFTKVQMKRHPHSMLSFTQSTLPHLQAMLMTYCQGSVANLKMVLSVLILSVKACMKACESEKHLGEGESCNGTFHKACASWRRLEADICEGDWLEKMPYHGGHVGFGGSMFASGEELNDSSEEYSRGDRMILRRLACLVILGSELEAVSSGTISRLGYRHIDHMSRFIVSKLRGTSPCKEETLNQGRWIFEIFGDQDDALIEIMLSLLKINLSAKANLNNESCKSSKSVRTGTDKDETPAENKEQCILDAHHVFISFLEHMTWDHSILLDLLISTETDFLEYCIRYLRLVATDWEGFVRVQRVHRKKEEDVPVICQILSSDANTDGDDGSHSNIGSDRDNDVGVDKDFDDEFIDADDNDSNQDFDDEFIDADDNDSNQDFDDEFIDADDNDSNQDFDDSENKYENNKELHGQTESEQAPKSSENFHSKRKCVQNEEMKEKAARKIQRTERAGHPDITIASVDVKKASCKELAEQEKNDLCIQSATAFGSLDDTMTILIRLRLAIDRLDKKGLFPFSATPLIRLLVQVEDMYENVDG